MPVGLREESVNIGPYGFTVAYMLDESAVALSFALAASEVRCSDMTLSSSAFWLLLLLILFLFRSALSCTILFLRYSVSACGLVSDGEEKKRLSAFEARLNGFVYHKGFVLDRDYFINRNQSRDIVFGIGLVQHEEIISNKLYPDAL